MDTNKEGFNVLYYDTVLHNIKLSKVVLCILLFTIFIILINPIKLLSVITINIFSVIGKQYEYLTNYNESYLSKILGDHDTRYISEKNHLGLLNKTLKELVMNTNTDKIILQRILKEMGSDIDKNKEYLHNLIKSIKLENELSDVDYQKFSNAIIWKDKELTQEKWHELFMDIFGEKDDKGELIGLKPNIELDTSQYKKFGTQIFK